MAATVSTSMAATTVLLHRLSTKTTVHCSALPYLPPPFSNSAFSTSFKPFSVPPVPSESLPERSGEPDCPYFLKTQRCKFGIRCKFNHPKDKVVPQFSMKTGKCKFGVSCKFHHPKDVEVQSAGEKYATTLQNEISGDSKLVQPLYTQALLHNAKGLPIRLFALVIGLLKGFDPTPKRVL